jgi:hypothetical protein
MSHWLSTRCRLLFAVCVTAVFSQALAACAPDSEEGTAEGAAGQGLLTRSARALDPVGFSATAPDDNLWINGKKPIEFKWTDATADLGEPPSQYGFFLGDNTTAKDTTDGATTMYTVSDFTALPDGSYPWFVRAFKGDASSIGTTPRTLRIERIAPEKPVMVRINPLATGNLWVSSSTPTYEFTTTDSGGSGLASYDLEVDGAPYGGPTIIPDALLNGGSTCNNPNWCGTGSCGVNPNSCATQPSPLPDGKHTVVIIARDAAGNETRSDAIEFTVDNDPPTAFALIFPKSINEPGQEVVVDNRTPRFCWEESTDAGAGLDFYRVTINTPSAGAITVIIPAGTTCYKPTNSLGLGAHTWFVTAFDKTGKSTDSTDSARFIITNDTTAPTVTFGFPTDTSGDQACTKFVATGTATDGNGGGVQTVEVQVQAGSGVYQFATLSGSVTDRTRTWTSPEFQGAAFVTKVFVRATDREGNAAVSEQAVSFDCTGPSAFTLVGPVNGKLSTGCASTTFEWNAATDKNTPVNYDLVFTNGTETWTIPNGTNTTASPDSAFCPPNSGSYTWFVVAKDALGNTTQSDSRTVLFDRDPPAQFSVTAEDGLNANRVGCSTTKPVSITWSATSDVGPGGLSPDGYAVLVDSSGDGTYDFSVPVAGGATSYTFTGLAEGEWGYAVQVCDNAANCASANQLSTGKFTIDCTAPKVADNWSGVVYASNNPDAPLLTDFDLEAGTTYRVTVTGESCTSGNAAGDPSLDSVGGCFDAAGQPTSGDSAFGDAYDAGIDKGALLGALDTAATARFPFVAKVNEPFEITIGDSGKLELSLNYLVANDYTPDGIRVVIQKVPGFAAATPVETDALTDATPTFTWEKPTDKTATAVGSGIATIDLFIDDVLVTTVEGTATSATVPDDAALAEGDHTFKLRLTDRGGLTATTAERAFTVDTAGPTGGALVATPLNRFVYGVSQPELCWNDAVDATSGFHHTVIYLDDAYQSVITAKSGCFKPSTALLDGTHTLKLIHADRAGLETAVTQSFDIDTQAPDAPVAVSPADGAYQRAAALTVCWTAPNDNGLAGVAKYVVSVTGYSDFETTETCGTADTLAPGASGTFAWSVKAVDLVGNTGGSSTLRAFNVDQEAPSTPLPTAPDDAAVFNIGAPQFTWSTATDNLSGVANYIVTIDGTEYDAGNNTAFVPSTGLADGVHVWSVRAVDVAGNAGVDSAERSFTTDTTNPPSPTFAGPAVKPVWLTNAQPTFAWEIVFDTTSGICQYGLVIDSDTELLFDKDTFLYATPAALAQGAHSALLTAIDCAGNRSLPTLAEFQIDSELPTAAVITGPTNDACVNPANATLTWAPCSDTTSGVATARVLVNDQAVPFPISPTDTSVSVTLSGVAAASYTVAVECFDAAGNSAKSASITVRVDPTPPACVIKSITLNEDDAAQLDILAEVTDTSGCGVSGVKFKLDTENAVSATLQATPDTGWLTTTRAPVPGSHEVTCIVTGTFGAEATTEAYTFENRACRTLGDCDENRVCSTFATMGTSCNDNDECSENDQCNDQGVCLGTEIPGCGEETTGGDTGDTGPDTETETTGDDDDTTTSGDDDDDTTGTETDTDAGTDTDTDTDGGTGTETDAGTDTTTTGGDDDDDTTTTGGTTGGTSTIPDQTDVPFDPNGTNPDLEGGCGCSTSPKETMPLSGGIWLLLVAFLAREYRRAKARKQARLND